MIKEKYDKQEENHENNKHGNLDKINSKNFGGLTEKEKENLKKASELLKNNPNKDAIINQILENKSRNKNTINSLDNIFSDIDLNFQGKSIRNKSDILNTIKLDEPIDTEYYSYIKDKKDFVKRKIAIENSDEILKKAIDPLAEKYEQEYKLSYKLRSKARFIMGMSKKFEKKKKDEENSKNEFQDENERADHQNELEEEISFNTNLEDDMIGSFKKRIKEEKEKKGRGFLVPFNQQNEDKKIPRLIRAMKLGLRVVLLSDAGTPTISDPGYKLVKEAAKSGIVIEPLPGPSAVLTGLSASALPTDKFMFFGYLPKNANEKTEKIEEIKQIGVTSVLFEAPTRLQSTLSILGDIYGQNHEIYIGLELTKRFENHLHGTIKNVKKDIVKLFSESAKNKNIPYIDEEKIFEDEQLNIKGEITLVLGPIKKSREEYLEEKNLSENINIDIMEFTKRLNKHLDLEEKDIREILIKVCEVPRIKATRVINVVKNRKSHTLKTFEMLTNKNLKSLKIPDVNKGKMDMLHEKETKNPSIKNLRSSNFK